MINGSGTQRTQRIQGGLTYRIKLQTAAGLRSDDGDGLSRFFSEQLVTLHGGHVPSQPQL